MQLFSIIMESRRVRCARAACLFCAIFRTHPLPLSRKREQTDRFLPSVQHRAVSFPLRDDVIQRSSLFHPAFITPLVTTTHRVIFPLYGAPLKFNEISRKRSTCEIRDRSFFFFSTLRGTFNQLGAKQAATGFRKFISIHPLLRKCEM